MRMNMLSKKTILPKQTGAALIISLIILLVMTIIGVTAIQTTSLEEKMAGNIYDRNKAFQSAEAVVRDAELFLATIVSTAGFNGTNGLYGIADTEPDYTLSATWDPATSPVESRAYGTDTANTSHSGITTQPRYFVKLVTCTTGTVGSGPQNIGSYGSTNSSADTKMFRITTRGTGGSDKSVVMIRSYFGRRGIGKC